MARSGAWPPGSGRSNEPPRPPAPPARGGEDVGQSLTVRLDTGRLEQDLGRAAEFVNQSFSELIKTQRSVVDMLEKSSEKVRATAESVRELSETQKQVGKTFEAMSDDLHEQAIATRRGLGARPFPGRGRGVRGTAEAEAEASNLKSFWGGLREESQLISEVGQAFTYRGAPGMSFLAQAFSQAYSGVQNAYAARQAAKAAVPEGQAVPGLGQWLASAGGVRAIGGLVGSGVGAGLAAGYAGYRIAQYVGEQQAQNAALSGEQGILGAQGAAGLEVRARMLALSPFISSGQAQEIVQGTLAAGYSGAQADTVMDYLASNVRNGMVDIGKSLELYRLGTQKARIGTAELTETLTSLRETAKGTQAGVGQLQDQFISNLQQLAALGVSGPGTGAAAGFMASTGALSGMGQLMAGYGGPDLSNQLVQQRLGMMYGVPFYALPGAIMQYGEETLPGVAETAAQMEILRIWPDIRELGWEEMIADKRMLTSQMWLAPFVNDPDILNNRRELARWMKEMMPGGKLTTENIAGEMWEQFHMESLPGMGPNKGPFEVYGGGRTSLTNVEKLEQYFEREDLPGFYGEQGLANPANIGWSLLGSSESDFLGRVANYYAAGLARGGKTNPLIENLLRAGTADQYLIRNPEGRLMSLEGYAREYGLGFEQMANLQMYEVPEKILKQHDNDMRVYMEWLGQQSSHGGWRMPAFQEDVLGQLVERGTAEDVLGVSSAVIGAGSREQAVRVMVDFAPGPAQQFLRLVEQIYYGDVPTNEVGMHD